LNAYFLRTFIRFLGASAFEGVPIISFFVCSCKIDFNETSSSSLLRYRDVCYHAFVNSKQILVPFKNLNTLYILSEILYERRWLDCPLQTL
jgi:hypothetical protein